MHDEPLITVRRDGRRHVRVSTAEYLSARVDRAAGPDACWPWASHRNKKGYGVCTSSARRDSTGSQFAHRISYEVANGPIPAGLRVLHRCDNPPCCNPAHLFLGTPKDNTQDMLSKGRGVAPKGKANGQAKLTDNQVREMHAMRANGLNARVIAARFGISHSYAGAILCGHRRPVLLDDSGGWIPYVGEVGA